MNVYRNIEGSSTVSCVLTQAVYGHSLMSRHEVVVNITVSGVLDIQVDDYIIYQGVAYTVNREPDFKIISKTEYSYNIVFEHPCYNLIDKLYTFPLTGSAVFTLTGKLNDFVQTLLWNINSNENPLGTDVGWTAGSILSTSYKTLVFDKLSCWDALLNLAKEFHAEFYINNKQINFVQLIENPTELVFEQGKGKGLYDIRILPVDKQDTITRVYPVGGNKNVRNALADENGNLKLPETYLENLSEFSRIIEKHVVFDEIFPTFEGEVDSVSGTFNTSLTCPEIDFDLNTVAVGDEARINFLTGDLMGNSFKFQYVHAEHRITLIQQEDSVALTNDDGSTPTIPNDLKKAVVGDKFNFTGILLPEAYETAAINKLRTTATDWLAFYSRKRVKFELTIDHRWMRGKQVLDAGDSITIKIPEKSITKQLRITSIDIQLDTGSLTATVSNYRDENWEKQVNSLLSNLSTIVSSETKKSTSLQSQIDAAAYLKQAIGGSIEQQGGLELLNLLFLKGIDGVVRAGMSGLIDNIVMWGGGTYEQALDSLANILFRKDGSGQLAGGKIFWDLLGALNVGNFKIEGGAIVGYSENSEKVKVHTGAIETLENLSSGVVYSQYIYGVNAPEENPIIGHEHNSSGIESIIQRFYEKYETLTVPAGSVVTYHEGTVSFAVTPTTNYTSKSTTQRMYIYKESTLIATLTNGQSTTLVDGGTYNVKCQLETNITLKATSQIDFFIVQSPYGYFTYPNVTGRTEIGNDGFSSFWSNILYLYFSKNGGLKYKGAIDIPAGLGGGTVGSLGSTSGGWGKFTPVSGKTGSTITITHGIGDSNYTILIMPRNSFTFYLSNKTNTTIQVVMSSSSGEFDYVLMRTV